MPPETPFSIQTVLQAPWKHKFKALLAFLIPVAIAGAAIVYLPKSYRSDAMIFVRLGRESVSLDPTANTGSTVPILESRESVVNSVRDMLYSGGLVEKVVDRIGPEVVLGDEPLALIPDEFPESPETDFKDSPRQQAIKYLSDKLYIINSRKSTVLIANCEAASPELAQEILRVFLEAYKKMHSVAHQTLKSNQFFANQADLLQEQWQTKMDKLRAAREAAGVVSVQGSKENLKNQTNEIQTRLMKVEAEEEAAKATLESLQGLARKPMNVRGVREDLKEATTNLASLTAEREILANQMKEMLERAAKLNHDEMTISQLEQQVDIARTNLAQYQELLEQTRIEEALLSGNFTNVRVVQPPSYIPKPVSPKRKIIALAGVFVGVAGATLISLIFEFLLGKPPIRQNSGTQPVNENNGTPADVSMASQGSLI